jgi:hypothetical protein
MKVLIDDKIIYDRLFLSIIDSKSIVNKKNLL